MMQRNAEVEITAEMIEAGYEVLSMYDSELGDASETAVRIYEAMEEARRREHHREYMRKRRGAASI
jgi:hypothetical protein